MTDGYELSDGRKVALELFWKSKLLNVTLFVERYQSQNGMLWYVANTHIFVPSQGLTDRVADARYFEHHELRGIIVQACNCIAGYRGLSFEQVETIMKDELVLQSLAED